jgi:DNA-binding transcriptional LysR family regulator
MNFRHLRYFVAASEHGSFRKAGAALGVQESTISRRVRDMEDGLGSALFHRHSGGVCLTVAGQRLLSKAQTVLRYINEGAEIVDAVGAARKVNCAWASSRPWPRVSCRIFSGPSPQSTPASMSRLPTAIPRSMSPRSGSSLDIAFLTGTLEWPRCETTYLWSERVFVVLPEAHALARRRK